MRLAILADVHANLPALEAVLRDVDSLSPAGLWVAGDLVGYNPWPNEVLQILRDRHAKAIRGNHDRGVLGDDPFRFNELAAAALRWTRIDRKSTRLNSSHRCISYAVFCLKKKKYQKR